MPIFSFGAYTHAFFEKKYELLSVLIREDKVKIYNLDDKILLFC